MSVLIVTLPGDPHARAVRWAIEQLGGQADILYPADLCNGAHWSLDSATQGIEITYGSSEMRLLRDQYRTVWMRRPPVLFPQAHIEDRDERAISEDDFGTLARSVYQHLERGRFVVNKVDSTRNAGLKPFQFLVAQEVGLVMPRTLIGNSPAAVHALFEECGGRVIFKPFKSPIWQTSTGPKVVPTTKLTSDMLAASDLGGAPGIFQEQIDKVSEVRATFIGGQEFAWEKTFDGRDDLDVDWRFMFKDAVHRHYVLPAFVSEACRALMRELDLVFGCFDFAVDQKGTHFFLEVNPQGQWLWGDALDCGLNQLEAMAEFLLGGNRSFSYSGNNRVTYRRFLAETDDVRMVENESAHFGHVMTFCYRQEIFPVNTIRPPVVSSAGNTLLRKT